MKTVVAPPSSLELGRSVCAGLGAFWLRLYQDRRLISRYCDGSGLQAAQIYLNFVEVAAALGRRSIPVFHRERWLPIVIRRSQQNLGEFQRIKVGQEPTIVMGPQPADTDYLEGQVFKVGRPAYRFGMVGYPTEAAGFVDGITHISDQIASPSTVLTKNTEFQIQEDTVVFLSEHDPFTAPDYARRTIEDPVTGETDEELLLWGYHGLQEQNLVRDNFGYAIDLQKDSSPAYWDQTNALWDLRFNGTPLSQFRQAVGEMLGVATIKTDGEVIEEVIAESDGSTSVVTNQRVYKISDLEELRSEAVPGAVFNQGDYLSNTVKLYPRLDPDKFLALNGRTLGEFLTDVPALYLPKGIIGNYSSPIGFIAKWEETEIRYFGDDSNGNPKLRFELGGPAQELDLFWQEIWDRAEADNESLSDFFASYLTSPPPYFALEQVVGSINPMKFYMQNFLKVNAGCLVVDFQALPAYIRSLEILGRLRRLIPAHTFLFIVARQEISEEPYDMGLETSDTLVKYNGLALSEVAGDGLEEDALQYGHGPVTIRWIRKCT
jgi:hypothetical protein